MLVLSAHDDDQLVVSSLKAGASGYLLKNVRINDLRAAIRLAHHGNSVLHPSIAAKVMNHALSRAGRAPSRQKHGALTSREMDILRLMGSGLSNRQIAGQLHLSVRTVQAHVSQIFAKLGVGSRMEAVLHALKEGWVTLNGLPPQPPAVAG